MSQTLTVKQFSQKVACKADLYEAVLRNGYHLPRPKSALATEAYLVGVMDQTFWCPRKDTIRLSACPRPPAKAVLMEKFLKLMKAKGYNPGVVDGRQPDKEWLLAVLATLSPEDEIFKKDYLPPAKKSLVEEQKTINVPNGFLEGLPDSRRKVKRKALHVVGEAKAKQKIEYLKALKREIEVQLDVQRQKAERQREFLKDPATRKPDSSPIRNKSSKRQQQLLSGGGAGSGVLNASAVSSKQPQVQQMQMTD